MPECLNLAWILDRFWASTYSVLSMYENEAFSPIQMHACPILKVIYIHCLSSMKWSLFLLYKRIYLHF
jgi:hypothetical protein